MTRDERSEMLADLREEREGRTKKPRPKKSKPATTYPFLVGAVLVALRAQKKISQASLARSAERAQSTWSRIETGCSPLDTDTLAMVARRLGMFPHRILQLADAAAEDVGSRNVTILLGRPTEEEAHRDGYVFVPSSVRLIVGMICDPHGSGVRNINRNASRSTRDVASFLDAPPPGTGKPTSSKAPGWRDVGTGKSLAPRRKHSRDGSIRCPLCAPLRCRLARG